MTQTIKNCNEIPEGKTYPIGDLRTAKSIEQLCEYVDAGHPIATEYGAQVKLLRLYWEELPYEDYIYNFDYFDGNLWQNNKCTQLNLIDYIKLAPLAYRNGRPLHVGDEIEIFRSWLNEVGEWTKCKATAQHSVILSHATEAHEWRFADEAEAA